MHRGHTTKFSSNLLGVFFPCGAFSFSLMSGECLSEGIAPLGVSLFSLTVAILGPGCKGLGLSLWWWSLALMVSQFILSMGTASLWPVYLVRSAHSRAGNRAG